MTTWTRDFDTIIFFREGCDVTRPRLLIRREIQLFEVGVEREVFDFTFFQVLCVVWLRASTHLLRIGGTSNGMQ
jgi:hypothetical protein